MRTHWKFAVAGEVIFGPGTVRQLGEELTLRGRKNAFIVTDKPIVAAGLVEEVRAPLIAAGLAVEVFEGGAPEPNTDIVHAAAAAARAAFGMPDCVIGIGGGSNLDVAKAVACVLAHGGACNDYFGEDKVPGPCVPMIAVPTTAGTGSESTPIAVIEDLSRHLKLAISSRHILPALAVVDPLMTVSCPPKVTAESGMDALTHAIESYTVIEAHALPLPASQRVSFPGRNPLSDTLAARAIQLIGANLRSAVYQPHHAAAREGMHLGALMAGMSFANGGLSSVHALQYPVGARTHTPHGLGNAILLPAVVEYLLPSDYPRFAEIAGWLGENVAGLSQSAAAQRCVDAIRRLQNDIGIPHGLSALGIVEADIPGMAQTGMTYQRLVRCSPRPLSEQALAWILKRAL